MTSKNENINNTVKLGNANIKLPDLGDLTKVKTFAQTAKARKATLEDTKSAIRKFWADTRKGAVEPEVLNIVESVFAKNRIDPKKLERDATADGRGRSIIDQINSAIKERDETEALIRNGISELLSIKEAVKNEADLTILQEYSNQEDLSPGEQKEAIRILRRYLKDANAELFAKIAKLDLRTIGKKNQAKDESLYLTYYEFEGKVAEEIRSKDGPCFVVYGLGSVMYRLPFILIAVLLYSSIDSIRL